MVQRWGLRGAGPYAGHGESTRLRKVDIRCWTTAMVSGLLAGAVKAVKPQSCRHAPYFTAWVGPVQSLPCARAGH